MKTKRHPYLIVTVMLGALLASNGFATPVQAQTAPVTIQNYTFMPTYVSVPVGATVKWVNQDPFAHTTSSDMGVWDSGAVPSGGSFSYTFNQAGTFPYHCHIHPFMYGAIVVGGAVQPGTLTVSVMPNVVATGSTAMVTGTGFTPRNWAFVYWQRPDTTTNGTWAYVDSNGMFFLRLGFRASHGTGVESVTAYDFATQRWAPFAQVTVVPGQVQSSQLSATVNPVPNGGTTAILGQGFSPGGPVFLQWQRPDGTMAAVWIMADSTGAFSLAFTADPRHGCGPRVFVAFDATRSMWTAPFTLGVTC